MDETGAHYTEWSKPERQRPLQRPLCVIMQHIYMEVRKMLMITLYAKQKKRHRCIEQ